MLSVQLSLEGGHRDGRVLLALRELVKDWAGGVSSPRGVILVGRFPDAYLVRTCNWRKNGAVKLKSATGEDGRIREGPLSCAPSRRRLRSVVT